MIKNQINELLGKVKGIVSIHTFGDFNQVEVIENCQATIEKSVKGKEYLEIFNQDEEYNFSIDVDNISSIFIQNKLCQDDCDTIDILFQGNNELRLEIE